ncbi:hypothetical protein ACFXTH_002958 [Malus domestica]
MRSSSFLRLLKTFSDILGNQTAVYKHKDTVRSETRSMRLYLVAASMQQLRDGAFVDNKICLWEGASGVRGDYVRL